ncbi:MAG: tetratricopeptide repeat protein [Chryseobacterium sp.]|jgi:tetratricopeptide (TPR) repeat protein|uniref:tetratricopeptide repeat protein n=1 Tax=Chryseobacterium sp. TaxID=1871047 RepID=UPI00282D3921|nr:tetratricopeptide repeat protein [Chryseobacterium sp.]MDR2237542.1 tetratricopeptide repeat protein [Chryseobacterium sp.]
MTLTKSKYYFEAVDNYPYYLADCLEALNYALAYDPQDADSLCLMGRIYSEILKDYETAKAYFEEALQNNISSISIPQYYISCLLNNEDYEQAEKLIEFALKLKGIDRSDILVSKALLFERQRAFKKALKQLKEVKKISLSKNMTDRISEKEKFIRSKMPKNKNKKKKKKGTK